MFRRRSQGRKKGDVVFPGVLHRGAGRKPGPPGVGWGGDALLLNPGRRGCWVLSPLGPPKEGQGADLSEGRRPSI